MNNGFQQRMQNYEVAPPGEIWDRVKNNIEPQEEKVVSIHSHKSKYFSTYLIAASILFFIIASIFLQIRPASENGNTDQAEPIITYKVANEATEVTPASNKLNKTSYVTLEGPHGKIKVSSKVAAIFTSPETPIKAQWNKKLLKWKNIMMTASNTNFMDVIPITQSVETEN